MSLKNAEKKKKPFGSSLASLPEGTDRQEGKNGCQVRINIRSETKSNISVLCLK